MPRSWRATAAAVEEGTPGWRRQFRPETVETIEQVRVRCVEITLPGTGSPDPAEIRLRREDSGGIMWWTSVGEYHDLQNADVATIPEALVLAVASIWRGIAAMADPALLTAWVGPWMTVEEVAALVPLVPAAWRPTVQGWPEYSEARIEQFRGTTEEGRLNTVTIDLPGLGPEDEDGSLPGICLDYAEGSSRKSEVRWSSSLPNSEGHIWRDDDGHACDVRGAIVAAVDAIERTLGDGLALAA